MTLRGALAQLASPLVFSRRLPAHAGGAKIAVTPGAALAYLRSLNRPVWQDLYEFAARHVQPGDVVWDVGANLAVFAFAAAHRAGPPGSVLAIEADPWLSTLIRRSIAHPRRDAATVENLCVAVSEQNGLQNFEITGLSRSGSHLASSTGADPHLVGNSVASHPVVTVSLDWLCTQRPPPQVVKIDIEGSELSALRGAETLLARHRPKLLLEVYSRSADDVGNLLRRHGYALYDVEGNWASPVRVTRPTYQTLALPE